MEGRQSCRLTIEKLGKNRVVLTPLIRRERKDRGIVARGHLVGKEADRLT